MSRRQTSGKKHIRTGKVERWQQIDRLVLLTPLFFPLVLMVLNLSTVRQNLLLPGISFFEGILSVGVYVLMCSVLSVPLMMALRAVSKYAKKAAVKNATFRVTEDFEYYREKLSGLSPMTISLLTDLQIEYEKDIAASLLRLTLMGVLSPEGKIIDRNRDVCEIDRILLDGLENSGFTGGDLQKIRDIAISEAEKAHLILWDDFLIYAVVLEEKRKISDELLKMKGLIYHSVKLL